MGCCNVKRAKCELQLAREFVRCVDSRSGDSISIAVELGHRSAVTLHIDSSAHDDKLLDTKECLRVLCSCKSNIGQGANRQDGDGIFRILFQDPKDLLVGGSIGGCEEGRIVLGTIGTIREEIFPSLSRGQIGMRLMNIMQPINAIYEYIAIIIGHQCLIAERMLRANSHDRFVCLHRPKAFDFTCGLSPFELFLEHMEEGDDISKTATEPRDVAICDRHHENLQFLRAGTESEQQSYDIIDTLYLIDVKVQCFRDPSLRHGSADGSKYV
ncbi:hypothetical protein HG530_004789 [Fusarium avenaceum]|nr:hypothetical protein HG530_004789 [Fusarium avenaceum]